MTTYELITAPWAERDKLAVAKLGPRIQDTHGLPDLPPGALYAGMNAKAMAPFKGWTCRGATLKWGTLNEWSGNAYVTHYARPYRDILDPPEGTWDEWEEVEEPKDLNNDLGLSSEFNWVKSGIVRAKSWVFIRRKPVDVTEALCRAIASSFTVYEGAISGQSFITRRSLGDVCRTTSGAEQYAKIFEEGGSE